MALRTTLHSTARALRTAATAGRVRAAAALAAAAIGVPLALAPAAAHAATGPIWGTLDTQTTTAATEAAAGVGMAMFEFNWAAYEPSQGKFTASYMTAMKAELKAYQAAGMKVTLGLGLQDPPAWALALANGTYIDQTGAAAAGAADLVFSAAVRSAAATYLGAINASMPLTQFWAIRLGDAAGDGEMLYPGDGTYYAFNKSALTGTGLPAGMTKNPDPTWKPGTPGLTPAQITAWITWYVGGLDNLTGWEMTTLTGLGFKGYYQTLTPGSGTRPDQLVADENSNLPNDGTTGVGAVWQLYYANLPVKTNVIAYISSVADNSGGNDLCTSTDDAQSLTSPALDSWSATRWITRIASQYGLPVAGENPGLNLPASLDTFYTNTTST
ncbi:MAG: hypothetical protein ACRDPY_14570, partial [Streptosporangiaceae bacterium]